jgi:hypothetical protein
MRVLILTMGLILFQSLTVRASMTIDVISVAYPPYTSPERADDGLVFRTLRSWLASRNLAIEIRALFLPPARAQHLIETTDWCMALYPPSENIPHVFRRIGNSTVGVGLARIKSSERFAWDGVDYFTGSRIAMLRTNSVTEYWKPFQDAGVEIVFVEDMDQALNMVLQGFADYAAVDSGGLEAFTRSRPQGDPELEISNQTVEEYPVGVYLSSRCRDILGPAPDNEKGAAEETAPLQN